LDGLSGADLLKFKLEEVMEDIEPKRIKAKAFLSKIEELGKVALEESKSREILALSAEEKQMLDKLINTSIKADLIASKLMLRIVEVENYREKQ
jgi:hypothetical protein